MRFVLDIDDDDLESSKPRARTWTRPRGTARQAPYFFREEEGWHDVGAVPSAPTQSGAIERQGAGDAAGGEFSELSAELATQLYDQVCTNVRATDESSFRLLSLVPLVSGGGIAILLSTNMTLARLPLVVFVGLFGAVVTFGLFRWELRNIQTCSRLIDVGAQLERERFKLPSSGQFSGRRSRPAPALFGRPIGKTEAERIIYSAVIGAWLLLPVVSTILALLDS